MDLSFLHYLPILTTITSVFFTVAVFKRFRSYRQSAHIFWWGAGIITFGLGTFAESWITLLGWNPVIFKFWYIVGAILGGAPLAQGTVWFLLKEKTAKVLTLIFISYVLIASIFITASPITMELVSPNLPSGKVLEWQWVRLFSPFINLYAVIFLIGGALLSAYRFYKASRSGGKNKPIAMDRFIGNLLIAAGAILPGIGGVYSRAGHTEILYLTEIIGLSLIWCGYWFNIRKRPVITQ